MVAQLFAAAASAVIGGAISSFFSDDDEGPELITEAPNPIAPKFAPINFANVFDELSKDSLEIVKGNDGKVSLRYGNSSSSVDLEKPVSSGSPNVQLPALRSVDARATEVVALSQSLTRLTNSIETLERTSPYLIPQNQELINSFRTAAKSAMDRGFDYRQRAIDQKLSKMGLLESSTSFGVQVALAREKANASAELELKQAELAQGLKQQAISNLHQRGHQIAENANVAQNQFNSEKQIEMANEQMRQQQGLAQSQLNLQNNQQRIDTELANRALIEQRSKRMTETGLNLFNNANNQAIAAQNVDNNAIANMNSAAQGQYSLSANPFQEAGMNLIGNALGNIGSSAGGSFGNSSNNWTNPDTNHHSLSFGTKNWSPNSNTLTGSKNGGMVWS